MAGTWTFCLGSSKYPHMEVFALGWIAFFFFFYQNDISNLLSGLRVVEEVPSYSHHAHHFRRQPLLISRFSIWCSTAVSSACCLCVLSSAINPLQEVNRDLPEDESPVARSPELWSQSSCIWTLALQRTSWATLGRELNLSGPLFPHWQSRGNAVVRNSLSAVYNWDGATLSSFPRQKQEGGWHSGTAHG